MRMNPRAPLSITPAFANIGSIFGVSYSTSIAFATARSKELIKTRFDELRQWWKDWNGSAGNEEQIATLGKKIEQFISQEEYAL